MVKSIVIVVVVVVVVLNLGLASPFIPKLLGSGWNADLNPLDLETLSDSRHLGQASRLKTLGSGVQTQDKWIQHPNSSLMGPAL